MAKASDKTTTTDEAKAELGQRTSTSEELLKAQEQGYFGTDAADAAGGIDKLRAEHQAAVTKNGTTLEGETEPVYPPGHPQDPTVRSSTTTK